VSFPITDSEIGGWREARISKTSLAGHESRTCFQKDRDRVLYSDAFRRLGFVTQVISPYEHVAVHTRLTHVLKVAQIGRRLAERLLNLKANLVDQGGGLNADVVEAAALAHDLGHPPFGHVVEEKLNDLAEKELKKSRIRGDGFEGNAQSFRLVTRLEGRGAKSTAGLDLTRATLNALLKYPWLNRKNPKKPKKWGAYKSEVADFAFARDQLGANEWSQKKTLEAEIMDWADDITYAVHDLEDFYRARKIPLHLLRDVVGSEEEIERILAHMFSRLEIEEPEREEYKSIAIGPVWIASRFGSLLWISQAAPGSHRFRKQEVDRLRYEDRYRGRRVAEAGSQA